MWSVIPDSSNTWCSVLQDTVLCSICCPDDVTAGLTDAAPVVPSITYTQTHRILSDSLNHSLSLHADECMDMMGLVPLTYTECATLCPGEGLCLRFFPCVPLLTIFLDDAHSTWVRRPEKDLGLIYMLLCILYDLIFNCQTISNIANDKKDWSLTDPPRSSLRIPHRRPNRGLIVVFYWWVYALCIPAGF